MPRTSSIIGFMIIVGLFLESACTFEAGMSCGGSNMICPRCDDGEPCGTGSDCTSEFCVNARCVCFSGDGQVTLRNGRAIFMRDLKVGDHIWTMSNDGKHLFTTEVMMMAHLESNTTSKSIHF